MDEAQIAENLKQNVQQPTHDMAAPIVGDPVQAPVSIDIDEITQYKLSQHLGAQYSPSDHVAIQQTNDIFNMVADIIGTREYPFVVSYINQVANMIGASHSDNKRFKLYSWLKLDNKRSKIEMEMRNV